VRRQPTSGPSSRDQRSGQFASGAGGSRHGLYFRSDIFSGIWQVNLAYGGCALLLSYSCCNRLMGYLRPGNLIRRLTPWGTSRGRLITDRRSNAAVSIRLLQFPQLTHPSLKFGNCRKRGAVGLTPCACTRARARNHWRISTDRHSDRMDQGPLASERFGCSAGSMPARTSPGVQRRHGNSQPVRSKGHIAMHSVWRISTDRHSDRMDQGPLASERFGCSAGSMPFGFRDRDDNESCGCGTCAIHAQANAEKACLLDHPLTVCRACERRSARAHAVGSDRGEAQSLFPNGEQPSMSPSGHFRLIWRSWLPGLFPLCPESCA
jgi:hypothetical protein